MSKSKLTSYYLRRVGLLRELTVRWMNDRTDAIDAATAITQPSTTNTVPTVDGPPAAIGQDTFLLSSSLRAATDTSNIEE